MVAKIRTYLDTNSTAFYETFYPRNGTLQVDTGDTQIVDGPMGVRQPMQVVWITVGVMIMILSIVAFVMFIVRHMTGAKVEESKKPQY